MAKAITRNGMGIIAAGTLIVMWVIAETVYRHFFPQFYFRPLYVVPVIFLIFALVTTFCIGRREKRLYAGKISHAKAFRGFMISKSVKLAVSLAILLGGIGIVGKQYKSFLVCFLAFYLVYLVLETMMQYNFEKRYKIWLEKNRQKAAE